MATENEIQLKAHVDELQRQVAGLTDYLNFIIPTINQNADQGESYSTSFWSQQQVDVCLPFYASDDTVISVMIEEEPGLFRQIHPAMTIGGQTITINFDRPYTGRVAVQGGSICGIQISPPPSMMHMGEVTLYEPALEMIPQPINPQPLTEKTPCGSEEINTPFEVVDAAPNPCTVDEQPFEIADTTGFEKAMGAIKKWPQ